MRTGLTRSFHVVIVAMALLSVCCLTALGAQAQGQQRDGLEVLCRQLGLRDAATVPHGVEPLVVDTQDLLREVVTGTRAIMGRMPATVSTTSAGDPMHRSLGLVETYLSFHYSMKVNPILGTRFNLWADVWVAGSGSFWEITDAYEWVGLTGISYCHDLSSEWHYHRIASDRRSIMVAGGAILDTYLLVKGVLKIYSEPVAISFTYRL